MAVEHLTPKGVPKWTPGPWETIAGHTFSAGDCTFGVQIWGRKRVAVTERQNVGAWQEEANANLIAAAPELYEALAALLDISNAVDGLVKVEWKPEFTAARAALAKARGETILSTSPNVSLKSTEPTVTDKKEVEENL